VSAVKCALLYELYGIYTVVLYYLPYNMIIML